MFVLAILVTAASISDKLMFSGGRSVLFGVMEPHKKTSEELRSEAIAELERRGYDVRGKTPAQIRQMLKARPRRRKAESCDSGTPGCRMLGLTSQSTDIARAWLMHCLEVCLVVVWLEATKCPSRH